jgi:hypothetical protein
MSRLSATALRKQGLKGCRSGRVADRGGVGDALWLAKYSGDRKAAERIRRNAGE